jgi:prepilin-type processing-associated H-X9-DG protein
MSGMGVRFATTWLLMEADRQLPVSDVRRMVPEPVHGRHRNAIFMDGHVRSIDVSESVVN